MSPAAAVTLVGASGNGLTDKVAVAGVTDPMVAVIVVSLVEIVAVGSAGSGIEPRPVPVAMPVFAMVATVATDEVHVTEEVRFCVVESSYVPVAVKAYVAPSSIGAVGRVTAILLSVALALTVTATLLLVTPPKTAVTVAEPLPMAVTRPELLTDATESAEEDHVTDDVTSGVEVSS